MVSTQPTKEKKEKEKWVQDEEDSIMSRRSSRREQNLIIKHESKKSNIHLKSVDR